MKKVYMAPAIIKVQEIAISSASVCARSGGTDCWTPER